MTTKYLPWFFLCAALATATVWLIHPHLVLAPQAYPDFIAGLIGFFDYNKAQEGAHFFLWLAVFFISFTALRICSAAKESPDSLSWFHTTVWMLLGVTVGRAFIRTELSTHTAITVLLGTAFLFIKDQKVIRAIGVGFFAAIVTLLSAISFFVFCTTTGYLSEALVHTMQLNVSVAMTIAATSVGMIAYKGWDVMTHRAMVLLQVPTVLMWLRFFNLGVNGNEGFAPFILAIQGQIFFSLCILISVGLLIKDFLNKPKNAFSISISSVVAGALLFGFSLPTASTFTVDPYHLGEMILPWQQIIEKGLKSYTEYVPVQGLISFTIGAVNKFFYHGEITTFAISTSVMAALIAVAVTMIQSWALSAPIALLFTPLALTFLDRFYLTGSSFLILSHPALIARPRRWFTVAAILLPIVFFWNSPSTLALTIGCAPVAAMLWWRSDKKITDITPALFVLAIVFSVLPIFGILQFVYENGFINTVQHATMFIENWRDQGGYARYFDSSKSNIILWETFRVGGWMWSAALLFVMQLAIIKKNIFKNLDATFYGAFLLTTGGIIFALFLFPYSMGRIDPPMYMSRPGTVSMVMFSFFVPMAFLFLKKYRNIQVMHPLWIGLIIGLPIGVKGFTAASLLDFPHAQSVAPGDYIRTASIHPQFDNLGDGYFPIGVVGAVQQLQRAVDQLIEPNDTYVDLTNHTAYHALLNRRFPSLYASGNADGYRIQNRILKIWEQSPPSAVLIDPFNEIDRTSIALRNYHLYRWLMTHSYHLISINEFSFLVSDNIFKTKKLTELPLAKLKSIVFRSELMGIPRAWGKSYGTLKNLVTETEIPIQITDLHGVEKLKEGWNSIQAGNGTVQLSLEHVEPETLRQTDYVYIRLETMTEGAKKPIFGITTAFNTNNNAQNSDNSPMTFWAPTSGGVLIIPITTDPTWFRSTPTGLVFSFGTENIGARWRFKSLKLLHLK